MSNRAIHETRTKLLMAMAEAGRAALEFDPLAEGAMAAIPYSDPEEYVVAGTPSAISKMLPDVVSIDDLRREVEILTAERDHERAKFDRVFEIMMSVYSLAPSGQDIKLPDGRVMRFNDPNAAETLHHLGRAIHAIPEKLGEVRLTAVREARNEANGGDDK
jgi:hypothetical protein